MAFVTNLGRGPDSSADLLDGAGPSLRERRIGRVLLRTQSLQQNRDPFFPRRSIETIPALSAQVPDARGELQPQKMKQGEDDLGVASGVGRVLEDRKIGLVIEDLVEDIGRVTNRRRDDLRPVLRVLVRGPGVESEAPSEAEIFWQRGRVLRRASNGESLAIGGGEGSTAPGLGKRQLVLEVHESREGSFERLLAQVPVRGPCELAVGQIGDAGPPPGAGSPTR